jgi:hypothetical protein
MTAISSESTVNGARGRYHPFSGSRVLPEKFRLEDWSELHVMRHLAEMLFLAQPSGHFGIHFLPA